MATRPALLRNLGLKVLALGIALLVWFVLSAQRRERISERSYRIALSVVNIPERTIIASAVPPTVDVRVRGPFTALRQVDPDKIEAVIDLQGATRGERLYRLAPEDINVAPEIEVIAISPADVRIVLDAVTEKVLSIAPNLTGTPAPGWEVGDVSIEPRSARIAGPSAVLGKMTSVSTDPVSLSERSATFSTPATVVADAPGVRVREGQIVTVTVHLHPVVGVEPMITPAPRPRKK
ncbi:MAG: CdaR family protein [Acidobacteriota bacterium]